MKSGVTMTCLGDLCDPIAVQIDPQELPQARYLGLEHLASSRFLVDGGGRGEDVQSSKFRFNQGDILYSKLRPYLDKAILAEEDGVCTTELLVLRPRKGIDPRFLVGVVHSGAFIRHAMSGVTGVQHPRTSWRRISEFELPEWDPMEQGTIADFIWTIHEAIVLNERAIEALSSLECAARRAMFSLGLRKHAQKESPIGLVPANWSVERLDRTAKVVSTRMSYSELEAAKPFEAPDALLVLGIKVSDMNSEGNESDVKTAALSVQTRREVAEHRCAPPGTIVFPKRGAAIATNKKRVLSTWAAFDPNVIGVVAGDRLESRFLFHWFQNFDLRTITEPGPTPQLNKKNLDPLLIPVPSNLDEQREVVGALDTIQATVDVRRKRQSLQERFLKAVLQKVVSGRMAISQAGRIDFAVTAPSEASS